MSPTNVGNATLSLKLEVSMIGRRSNSLGVASARSNPIAFLLLPLLFVRPAFGTAEGGENELRFRVPFTFTVNSTRLPPGTYEVSTTLGGALCVRGSADGAFAWPQPVTGVHDGEMKLVFYKQGREHVLSEVWMGGKDGHELARPTRGPEPGGVRAVRNRAADDGIEWVTIRGQ